MFTGIIQELGTVAALERARGLVRVTVHAPATASRVRRLESVAVNGVCLSVVTRRQHTLVFELIPETQRLTTLVGLRAGRQVNLEPSLTLADRLGGQILFGHVDGLGRVVGRQQRAGEVVLEIRVARDLRNVLVPKGPVALDGVSLTVGRTLTASTFTVHLIPETVRQTTLKDCAVGDTVNVELDYLAKLVWQFLTSRNGRPRTAW